MADSKISALSDGSPALTGDQLVIARSGSNYQITAGKLGLVSYRKTSSKQVTSTVSETDLLNGEITLAAGVLGTDRIARLEIWGDWLQNVSNGTQGPRFKFKLGGTTIFDTDILGSNVASTLNSTTRWPWRFVIEIAALGATNSQAICIDGRALALENSGGANPALGGTVFLTGVGHQAVFSKPSATMFVEYLGSDTAAKDSTASLAVEFTVINGSNSGSYDTTLRGALLQVI